MPYRDELETRLSRMQSKIDQNAVWATAALKMNKKSQSHYPHSKWNTIVPIALIVSLCVVALSISIGMIWDAGHPPEPEPEPMYRYEKPPTPPEATADDIEECIYTCASMEWEMGYDEEREMVSCTCYFPPIIDLRGHFDD